MSYERDEATRMQEATEAMIRMRQHTQRERTRARVTDAMVEKAWAAIVGRDIAPQCFNASIIRADLRTALEAIFSDHQ